MSADTVTIPQGMIEVTQKEFYKRLYADPRDIMPTTNHPDFTSWEVVWTRAVWGWSSQGWRNSGNPHIPKHYAIKETNHVG
jgi:hypothetical protein